MSRAYECIVHPEFYRQIGTDIPKAIAEGKEVVVACMGREPPKLNSQRKYQGVE